MGSAYLKLPNSSGRNSFGLMGSTAIVALVECDGPPETSTPLRVSRFEKVLDRFLEFQKCWNSAFHGNKNAKKSGTTKAI